MGNRMNASAIEDVYTTSDICKFSQNCVTLKASAV